MRRTELHLTDEDRSGDRRRGPQPRRSSQSRRSTGRTSWPRWTGACRRRRFMAVLGVGRTALWRTRAAYLQGGLELALFDVARPGRPRKYDTGVEARITALACSAPPPGRRRWTMVELERAAQREPGLGKPESRNGAAHAQKNDLKPWRRLMWCIGVLTEEYRQRMYGLLALYGRPMSIRASRWCASTRRACNCIGRQPRAAAHDSRSAIAKDDYEYVRQGTTQPVRGRRTQGRTPSGHGNRAARQGRLRRASSPRCSAASMPPRAGSIWCWTT
ncbi:MAG: helix-turn-helix domain-containing protein [Comamonadaceae bacterium]|nr:helix-turn-helix domain-containing protein [Comamonadaceae bacterium]